MSEYDLDYKEKVSDCCAAPAIGEIDYATLAGRCSNCKEMTMFTYFEDDEVDF